MSNQLNLPEDPVGIVKGILAWAVEGRATDLHFTPRPEIATVRGRVDGVLREIHSLPMDRFKRVVSRIKVLAGVDIAEKRRPHDGRISMTLDDGRPVDFRLSSIPSLHGESVVLRVLDRSSGLLRLDRLGLSPRELGQIRSLVTAPNGLVLVVGPTGAGKTTTLYGAISEIASPERNVVTIEDPIEYELEQILQTNVQTRIGLDFADLLRSILRHDPDIILVGEIRDAATAEVAVRAAHTGHLVLSSLHAHRAAQAVTAMFDFGIEAFALGPSLRGVVAQQLVRLICRRCQTSFEYGDTVLNDPDLSRWLKEGEQPSFSIGMGCDECFQSGYAGRRGLFEILEVSERVRETILTGPSATEVERVAEEMGMASLRQNGFRLVLHGETTIEEVLQAVHVE